MKAPPTSLILVVALSALAFGRVALAQQPVSTVVLVRPVYVLSSPPMIAVPEPVDARFVPADDVSDAITVLSLNPGSMGTTAGECATPCSLTLAPGSYEVRTRGRAIGRAVFESGQRRFVVRGPRSRAGAGAALGLGIAGMDLGLCAALFGALESVFNGSAGSATAGIGLSAFVAGLVTTVAGAGSIHDSHPLFEEAGHSAHAPLDLARARVGFTATGNGGAVQLGLAF